MQTAWKIKGAQYLDDFFGMVVEGKQRIGKSSYCLQSMAEAHGKWDYWEDRGQSIAQCVRADYEAVKKWVAFPPKQVIDIVLGIPAGTKEMAMYWSDAGFWIFALDWYEPFVKACSKYIQLAGRQFGAVFFSSPSKKLISGKVLEALPGLYVCRIVKRGQDAAKRKLRDAKVYERWDYPDGKKGGVYTRWIDHYDAILPDPIFQWYKPISDHYMDIGKEILRREITSLQKKLTKGEEEERMEAVHEVVGDPARLKEIEEVLQAYEPPK